MSELTEKQKKEKTLSWAKRAERICNRLGKAFDKLAKIEPKHNSIIAPVAPFIARLELRVEKLERERQLEERRIDALERIAESLTLIADRLQKTNQLIAEQNALHGNRNETLKKKFE